MGVIIEECTFRGAFNTRELKKLRDTLVQRIRERLAQHNCCEHLRVKSLSVTVSINCIIAVN